MTRYPPHRQPLALEMSDAAVESLGAYYDEPDWMRAARREAWALFEALPLPSNQEEVWRRAPLERYPWDDQRVVIAPKPVADLHNLPPCWVQPLAPENQLSGLLVHCNGSLGYRMLDPREAAQGVVLDDLHAALHTHGELIHRTWMQGAQTRPDFNKFTALNAALWHGGAFLYVPPGVKVLRPVQLLAGYNAQGGAGLPHTLIIVGKGARVTVLQDRTSQESAPALNAEVVEIIAEEGAWVRYASFQHWGDQSHTVSVQEARLARDAHLLWVSGGLGGLATKEFLRAELLAPGARVDMRGFTFAAGEQYSDQSTYQHHAAPETYSDLLFRNVLRERARTVFYGMVRVEAAAQRAQGYQTNHNLLLEDARAHSIPGLEILTNDVQCSHGSTVARLDEDQLFYLQARGIARPQAEQLLVQGFLRSIVEQVPLAYMRERLEEELELRATT